MSKAKIVCDSVQVIGLIIIGIGLWWYYPPLCLVVIGSSFIWIAYVSLSNWSEEYNKTVRFYVSHKIDKEIFVFSVIKPFEGECTLIKIPLEESVNVPLKEIGVSKYEQTPHT
jgi:hypothetical protein